MSVQGSDAQIAIVGLEVFGRHGVFDAERELGQRFVVDLFVDLDLAPATVSDRVEDTVDYAGLADAAAAIVAGEPVALLERLAQLIAERVLEEPHASAVTVTVHKPHVAIPHPVTESRVTVRRRRGRAA